MVQLGKKNILRSIKQVDFGFYLDGGDEFGEILLPKRYVPEGFKIGDKLEVFLYLDSEDRVIATTETALAQVGSCAHLKVVAIGPFGAFMNWGLTKDLLIPFKEQRIPMQVGKSYTVFVYIDKTGRIAGSSKLSLFLAEENKGVFTVGQKVNLHVASRSDVGYRAIINQTHLGVIHQTDILQPIPLGHQCVGYIKHIRPDGLIDIMLQPKGEDLRDPLCQQIIDYLTKQNGACTLTDKSPPEEIYKAFHVSKSNYKKALGNLYKQKKILIDEDVIRLL